MPSSTPSPSPNPDRLPEGVPCRTVTLTALGLLGTAAVLFTVGLLLTGSDDCRRACETIGLTVLYAGGPVSALFGVIGGAVVVAWPVDVITWIMLSVLAVRIAERRAVAPLRAAAAIVGAALVYGFILQFFVELA